jgi:hypothetical protein
MSACRSANHGSSARSGVPEPDPSLAAKEFFTSHYDFYYEDPARFKALITPRLYRALKHHHDAFDRTRQIGALDRDPWTNAQDGEISKPYSFTTLKAQESEAVVRFQYLFVSDPKNRITQSVLMNFERPTPGETWLFCDLIMSNNESLLRLLERIP